MEVFELYETPVVTILAYHFEGVLCTSNESVGEDDGYGSFVQ
jgi:hypothetical protein